MPTSSQKLSDGGGGDSREAVPERLLLGVTIEGVKLLLRPPAESAQHGLAGLTGYENQLHAAAAMQMDGLSSCERLQKQGGPHVGRATVFVSWWLGTTLDVLVSALERFLEQQSTDAARTFFWICDFSVRQSDSVRKGSLYGRDLSRTQAAQLAWQRNFGLLPGIVSAVEHAVLVCDQWDQPQSLRRAWVLWEVHLALRSHVRVDVVMGRAQSAAFRQAMEDDGRAAGMLDVWSRFDVRSSESYLESDREMILSRIASSGGCDAFNAGCIAVLQAGMVAEGRRLVDEMRTASARDASSAAVASNVSELLRARGEICEACALACEALRTTHVRLGAHHEETSRYVARLTALRAQLVADVLVEVEERESETRAIDDTLRHVAATTTAATLESNPAADERGCCIS